jgi:hypothetical protein
MHILVGTKIILNYLGELGGIAATVVQNNGYKSFIP